MNDQGRFQLVHLGGSNIRDPRQGDFQKATPPGAVVRKSYGFVKYLLALEGGADEFQSVLPRTYLVQAFASLFSCFSQRCTFVVNSSSGLVQNRPFPVVHRKRNPLGSKLGGLREYALGPPLVAEEGTAHPHCGGLGMVLKERAHIGCLTIRIWPMASPISFPCLM